jgi:hypothetical protein
MISYPITICPRCGSVSCIRPGGWDTTDVCERCEKEGYACFLTILKK